jgi:hypothetical protein
MKSDYSFLSLKEKNNRTSSQQKLNQGTIAGNKKSTIWKEKNFTGRLIKAPSSLLNRK